jgi:hypothetical protein
MILATLRPNLLELCISILLTISWLLNDYSQFQRLHGCIHNLIFAVKFINSKSKGPEEGEEE